MSSQPPGIGCLTPLRTTPIGRRVIAGISGTPSSTRRGNNRRTRSSISSGPSGLRGHADRPDVTVRVFQPSLTPAVGLIGGGRQDDRAGLLRPYDRGVRVHFEQPQLGAQAAPALAAQPLAPGMALVGVVGVEHEVQLAQPEGREIGVPVAHLGAEYVVVERDGAGDVRHQQVQGERRQRAAVLVRRHPWLTDTLLRHRRHYMRPAAAGLLGSATSSSTSAARAVAPPRKNGAEASTASQSTPAITLESSTIAPMAPWYSPRAVARLSLGTKSETSARPTPSVIAMYSPYTANSGQTAAPPPARPKPMYTAANTANPSPITLRRPRRSEAIPAGIATVAYTRLNSM